MTPFLDHSMECREQFPSTGVEWMSLFMIDSCHTEKQPWKVAHRLWTNNCLCFCGPVSTESDTALDPSEPLTLNGTLSCWLEKT